MRILRRKKIPEGTLKRKTSKKSFHPEVIKKYLPKEKKFRVWDYEAQRMYTWDKIYSIGPMIVRVLSDGEVIKIFDFVVMLWSGIADERRVDIYEGDILLETDRSSNEIIGHGIVVFRCLKEPTGRIGGFGMRWCDNNGVVSFCNPTFTYQVTGNIFENRIPER